MIKRALVSIVLVGCVISPLTGQSKDAKRVGLDEEAVLKRMVDEAAAGTAAAGNAWLKWTPHFLRGPDGKTYVPFTLKIEEAPDSFRAAAMYVRVAPSGDLGRLGKRAEGVQNVLGVPAGELPINSPDRRQGAGAPTASDASVMLRSLTAKAMGGGYPYEAMYSVTPTVEGKAAVVRRALAVPPGKYDVYIALVDRDRKGDRKWALLKLPITIPTMAAGGLRVSSVIVADAIQPLAGAVKASDQGVRPYALGAAELTPASDTEFRRDETLQLAFVIYDAVADAAGKPDVRVEYWLYHRNFTSDRLLGSTAPQALNNSTLPDGFDLRAGHQLAAVQSLPLAAYSPGAYRMVIRVTDNRSQTTVEEEIQFVIES